MTDARLEVSFNITGFTCTPEEVTARLGVTPSRVWRTGDAVGSSAIRRKFNGWLVQSTVETQMNLEEHVHWLLEHLPQDLSGLTEISPEWHAELACSVYVHDQTPAMALDSESLKRLAALGAGLDIDIYVLGADNDTAP